MMKSSSRGGGIFASARSTRARRYSTDVSELMASKGAHEEERLVQTTRAEFYEQMPAVAVWGGGLSARKNSVIKSVSTANLRSISMLSMTNLMEAGKESSKVNIDTAKELEKMVDKKDKVTGPLALAVTLALVIQFLNGYNCSVLNAPAAVVFPGHSTSQWALAVGGFAIGGPFGSYAAGSLADKLGRKKALAVCTWIFFLGGLLMAMAPGMEVLIVARLVTGFASGFSSVLVPIYMGELSPPTLRGFFGTCTQFALVVGILVATVLGFPLATPSGWRIMFAVTPALCVVLLATSNWLYESPRWLLRQDRHSEAAAVALKNLYGLQDDDQVAMEIEHILNAVSTTDDEDNYTLHEDKSIRPSDKKKQDNTVGALDLFNDDVTRPMMITAIVLHVSQQFCGINAVFYYSTTFFEGVIDNPLLGSTLVAAVNVLATMLATVLMDSYGRRVLMVISSGGMFLSTAAIIMALLGVVPKLVALGAVAGFVGFFEVGLGPIPWLIGAEMFEADHVAVAQSFACQVNWFCNFVVGVGFPYLQASLGPWSFLPFGAVLVACLVFVLTRMPETLGLTPKEVVRDVRAMWGGMGDWQELGMDDRDLELAPDQFDKYKKRYAQTRDRLRSFSERGFGGSFDNSNPESRRGSFTGDFGWYGDGGATEMVPMDRQPSF